jgi:eukaryotic-like serine/threonine-protein kinase
MAENLGRYELIDLLATGGMGEVFLARDTDTGNRVVVKRILRHLATDQGFINLFRQEAALSKTLRHKNIAQVYALERAQGSWFIAMEYVEGLSVRQLLSHQKMPQPLVFELLLQALSGLHYAHHFPGELGGILHRDLTCENILVSTAGEVKIIDFGVARAMGAAVTTIGRPKGKLPYMAPEQLQPGVVLDSRVDVYSLGVVLAELLLHERPLHVEHGFDVPPDARPRYQPSAQLSQSLNELLAKATHPQREFRLGSAVLFETELKQLGTPATPMQLGQFIHDAISGESRSSSHTERIKQSQTHRSLSQVTSSDVKNPRRTIDLEDSSVSSSHTNPVHQLGRTETIEATKTTSASMGKRTVVGLSVAAIACALALLLAYFFTSERVHDGADVRRFESIGLNQVVLLPVIPTPIPVEQKKPVEEPVVPKKKNSGRVDFRVKPWAEIWLGGKKLAVTPTGKIELNTGRYVFVLKNPDLKKTKKIKVQIKLNQTETVRVDMNQR